MKVLCFGLCFFFFFWAHTTAWAQEKNPVLAEIKRPKIVITKQDLEKYIDFYGPEAREYLQSPEKKAEFLQDVVKMLAIAAYAHEQGFDQLPEMQEKIHFLAQKFVAKEYLKHRLDQTMQKESLTEAELKLYYKTHQEEFRTPPKVRLSLIIFEGPEPKLKALQAKAKEMKASLDKGVFSCPFDPSLKAKIVGDTGLLAIQKFEGSLGSLPLRLPLGKWSDPILSQKSLFLVKVLERKEAKPLPFEEVKEKIRKKLLSEIRQAQLRKLIKEILKAEEAQIYYQNLLVSS